MTHDELENSRQQFMRGEMSAASYYADFESYWGQFKNNV